MPPDRVFVFPGETKLKIMAGNSFVNSDRPRILRSRAPEVTEVRRRFGDVTDAVLFQSRRRSEIVHFAESLQRAQIFRHWTQRVMLKPIGDGENAMLVEKLADRQIFLSGI